LLPDARNPDDRVRKYGRRCPPADKSQRGSRRRWSGPPTGAHLRVARPCHSRHEPATVNGTRQTPDNLGRHLLTTVCERANEALVERGDQPIARLTPHTLRTTFASLLAEVGVPSRRAMYLLGHPDPTLTMRVYQQVLDMRGSAPEQLERVLGCSVDEALALLSGREVSAMKKPIARAEAPQHRAEVTALDGESPLCERASG
jgi:integrase